MAEVPWTGTREVHGHSGGRGLVQPAQAGHVEREAQLAGMFAQTQTAARTAQHAAVPATLAKRAIVRPQDRE